MHRAGHRRPPVRGNATGLDSRHDTMAIRCGTGPGHEVLARRGSDWCRRRTRLVPFRKARRPTPVSENFLSSDSNFIPAAVGSILLGSGEYAPAFPQRTVSGEAAGIATIAIVIWALMESGFGVNPFRCLLGGLVFSVVVVSQCSRWYTEPELRTGNSTVEGEATDVKAPAREVTVGNCGSATRPRQGSRDYGPRRQLRMRLNRR